MSVQCAANSLRPLAAPSSSSGLARNAFLIQPCRPSRRTGCALVRAADSSPPAASGSSSSGAAGDKAVVPDDEFTLAKVSFGVIGLGIGGSLLSYGFGAYFNLLPGSEWSALMLTYRFPLTIIFIDMALKYAELKPVPCITYSDAFALREKCATPILKQDNEFICGSYRCERSVRDALCSVFAWHNEGTSRSLQGKEEAREDGKQQGEEQVHYDELFARISSLAQKPDALDKGISPSDAAFTLGISPALAKDHLLNAENKRSPLQGCQSRWIPLLHQFV